MLPSKALIISIDEKGMGFSFPLAYFLYKIMCGFTFFPFLNFLGVFVVMGIGVDDLFVVVDKWHQAVVHLPPDAPVADIAAAVGPDAALAMLLTSITTAAAFFATCLVPVAPIRLFALFMGFLVLADYALCLSISFPAACLQHRWLTAARRGQHRCTMAVLDLASCCHPHGAPAEGTPAVEKPKRLDRLMAGPVHTLVYRGRFVLIATFVTAIGLCGWRAFAIPPPSTAQVQMLPSSNVAQQFLSWSAELRGSSEDESSSTFVCAIAPPATRLSLGAAPPSPIYLPRPRLNSPQFASICPSSAHLASGCPERSRPVERTRTWWTSRNISSQ